MRLAGESAEQAMRRIVRAHARLRLSGTWSKVVFCTPSREEEARAGRREGKAQSDGKPIYDTVEAAEAAAAELSRLYGARLRVYQCPRSRHGHCHVTSKEPDRPTPSFADVPEGSPPSGESGMTGWLAARQVVLAHARLRPDRGRVVLCAPSGGGFGEAVYDTRGAAEAAAAGLSALYGAAMAACPCPRAGGRHWHVGAEGAVPPRGAEPHPTEPPPRGTV